MGDEIEVDVDFEVDFDVDVDVNFDVDFDVVTELVRVVEVNEVVFEVWVELVVRVDAGVVVPGTEVVLELVDVLEVLDADAEVEEELERERYQFALSSFKHSPTVTPFHPLFLITSK